MALFVCFDNFCIYKIKNRSIKTIPSFISLELIGNFQFDTPAPPSTEFPTNHPEISTETFYAHSYLCSTSEVSSLAKTNALHDAAIWIFVFFLGTSTIIAYLTTQIELRNRCLNFNGEPPFTTHNSVYDEKIHMLVLTNEGFL